MVEVCRDPAQVCVCYNPMCPMQLCGIFLNSSRKVVMIFQTPLLCFSPMMLRDEPCAAVNAR